MKKKARRGRPLSLEIQNQRGPELVSPVEVRDDGFRGENAPRLTQRLEAAREVDCVAPQVVCELPLAYYPRDRGSGCYADAHDDSVA